MAFIRLQALNFGGKDAPTLTQSSHMDNVKYMGGKSLAVALALNRRINLRLVHDL